MMADNVVVLCPRERVAQDAEPIASIYRNLGTVSAEQVVTRALAELAMTMAGLSHQVQERDLSDIAQQLRKLGHMAGDLGMISLKRCAEDVVHCLRQGDSTAFSAVWARLVRVAERCLSPDGDLLDTSLN